NIAEELAAKRVFQLSILDIGRLSVTVLVVTTNSSDLKMYITELARQFGDVTGLCLTSTLSSRTERVTEIPSLFQDVKSGKSR
ncbi:AraC family transcriptional regulator, partial [Priestia megaterium]